MSLDIVYFPALIEFQYTYSNDSGASYTDNIPENLRQWTRLAEDNESAPESEWLLSVCRIGTLERHLILHGYYTYYSL